MPKYFFHVYDGDQLVVHDTQGVELPDESEVTAASRSMIETVLSEPEFAREISTSRSFQVVDESGRVGIIIPFDQPAAWRSEQSS